MEQTSAVQTTGPRPVTPTAATEPQKTGSSPSEQQSEGGEEEKTEESVFGVTEEEEEANADKTVNPTKGSLHVCIL